MVVKHYRRTNGKLFVDLDSASDFPCKTVSPMSASICGVGTITEAIVRTNYKEWRRRVSTEPHRLPLTPETQNYANVDC
jgi:hypothetical protein